MDVIYTHLLFLTQEVMQEYSGVMWFDCSVRLRHRRYSRLMTRVIQNRGGLVLRGARGTVYSYTNNRTFDYLPVNQTAIKTTFNRVSCCQSVSFQHRASSRDTHYIIYNKFLHIYEICLHLSDIYYSVTPSSLADFTNQPINQYILLFLKYIKFAHLKHISYSSKIQPH